MAEPLLVLVITALIAVASSRRARVRRAALRWLTGGTLRRERPFRERAVRSARRTAGTAAALAAAWGAAAAPGVTLPVLAVLASGGMGYGAYRGAEWQRQRSHHRRWVRPAYMAARDIAAWPAGEHPGKWLTVAPDRSLVTAKLPVGWKGEASEQARLSQVLATRIGIDSPVIRWQLAGHAPRLELAQSPPPPGKTVLADALAVLERAKPDELVWGRGKRGAWVITSLSGDSPHVGMSMGSGAGKSTLGRFLLAQLLHRGAIGIVLDVKMISQQWAEGLPNAMIYRRPAEIHAALCWLGAEVQRRNEVALAGAGIDGTVSADVGPRIFVLGEELNAAIAMLRAWWREERAPSDPVRPPSLTALDLVNFTGRQTKVNLGYVGQRLSDKATGGGGDARESIGVIAFGRWKPSTWKMLAADHPMPPKSNTPGRIQVVSDEVRECQAVLMTEAEAREYALSGRVSPLPAGMPGAPVPAEGRGPVQAGVPSWTAGTDLVISRPELRIVPGEAVSEVSSGTPAVTLREAVEAGVLRMSLAAARKARTRRADFPEPVGRDGTAELYDLSALADYANQGKG